MFSMCCDDVFVSPQALTQHIQAEHIFKCSFCGQLNLTRNAHEAHNCVPKVLTSLFFEEANQDFQRVLADDESRGKRSQFSCVCGVHKAVTVAKGTTIVSHSIVECAGNF